METEKIRIPAPFSKRSWKVPVNFSAGEENAAYGSFEKMEDLLAKQGFEKVYGCHSIPHNRFQFHREDSPQPVEEYAIWAHPQGILADFHSYTTGGYVYNGVWKPQEKTTSSLNLAAVVDVGMGPELQHRAAVRISGSGSQNICLDGSQVRPIESHFNSNSQGIARFFEKIQQYGRLLPFEDWKENNESLPWLDSEWVMPLTENPVGAPIKRDDFLEKFRGELEEREKSFLEQLPPSLADIFQTFQGRRLAAENRASRPRGVRWDPVEFAIKAVSEAMFLGGKRFPKPQESELLTHWSKVALGEMGEDLSQWRAFEEGPAGLSLPLFLLHAKNTAPMASKLIDVLEQAPEEVLRRWAVEPDAAGFTLGLRALQRLFCSRLIDSHPPLPGLVNNVLSVLHQRLGAEGLPMTTSRWSALGLVVAAEYKDSGADKHMAAAQAEFGEAILQLEDWGIAWDQDLRWRSHPNLFTDKEKPQFFREDGPVSIERLAELTADKPQDSGVVRGLLLKRRLEASWQPSSSVRSRPRM